VELGRSGEAAAAAAVLLCIDANVMRCVSLVLDWLMNFGWSVRAGDRRG
jgi:hypothetical protein